MSPRGSGFSVIVASLVAALMLMILPLPDWLEPFRPDWVTLALIYWCLALPSRVSVGIAWVMGLLLDVAAGSLLGQHALGCALVAYLVVESHQRVRLFPLWQQALVVFLLLVLKLLLMAWVEGISGTPPRGLTVFAPALVGMLLWPWVFGVLRHLRRAYGVT